MNLARYTFVFDAGIIAIVEGIHAPLLHHFIGHHGLRMKALLPDLMLAFGFTVKAGCRSAIRSPLRQKGSF